MECEVCGYACDSEDKLEKHMKVHAVGFECVSCAYTAPSRAKWREHIYSPSHVAIHKCTATPNCGFVAETTERLKYHLKAAHKPRKGGTTMNLNCSKCDFVAETRLQMKRHRLSHQEVDISTKKFLCPICNWLAENERKYKNHLWRHSGDEHRQHFRCDYKDCEYQTFRKSDLTTHKRRRHRPDAPTFNCNYCPKTFNSPDSLRYHQRLHTAKRAIFVCPVIEEDCRYTTSLSEYLRVHMRHKHPDQKLFKCSKCEFLTRETATMELHVLREHIADGLFRCEKCGYETCMRKSYEKHVCARSEVRKSRCVICKDIFGDDMELERHMATHKEKVVRLHSCPRCDFTSEKKKIFKVHVEGHMKDESARTAAPNLTKCVNTLNYRDYGPPTTTSGSNFLSTISNRWTDSGFDKDVEAKMEVVVEDPDVKVDLTTIKGINRSS